jgi:hypothetical protein
MMSRARRESTRRAEALAVARRLLEALVTAMISGFRPGRLTGRVHLHVTSGFIRIG